MNTTTGILGGAAIVALIATAFGPVESRASIPSSSMEQAATAELNRDILLNNAAVDEHNKILEARYQEEKRQYEARQQQYQVQRKLYQDNFGR